MNQKAFFFTFAVILFASTIVFLTQDFSNKNLTDERIIVSSYRSTILSYLNDDISYDLQKILGFSTNVDYNTENVIISISDSFPKNDSLLNSLKDYNLFLNNNYFPRFQGDKFISFSENSYKLNYGSDFEYVNTFDTNSVIFVSSNERRANSFDLNLNISKLITNYYWVPTYSNDKNSFLKIKIFSDYNYFEIEDNFDPTNLSYLVLEFDNGQIDLNFGKINEIDSSFLFSSTIEQESNYSIIMDYSFDKNELPIVLDYLLKVNLTSIDSNSFIVIKK